MTQLADLERILVSKKDRLSDFLAYHRNQVRCPIYASVDVRRNPTKAAVVDANAFPAGFNNLSQRSRGVAVDAVSSYMRRAYPEAKRVLVLAEDHTRNAGYFESLRTLEAIWTKAGYDVTLGTLNQELWPMSELDALTGKVRLHAVVREGSEVMAGPSVPDVVICNNDLSAGAPAILDGLAQPVNPPVSMGWHRRRKAEHFRLTDHVVGQLGEFLGFDPWLLRTEWTSVPDVDFRDPDSLGPAADAVDAVLARVQAKYDQHGVKEAPRVFVKADPGTYGMGIVAVGSGEELRRLNSKGRERMDRGKGKVKTASVIVQESVPSHDRLGDSGTAEPVVYLVCGRVVGGFWRIHGEKGPHENLNSPGARFQPLGFCTTPGPAADEIPLSDPDCRVFTLLGEVASIVTGYELQFAQTSSAPPHYP